MGSIKVDFSSLQDSEALKADLVSIDLVSGPMYMQTFLEAFEKVARIGIEAHRLLDGAKNEVNHQEALAKLERAPLYFEVNGTCKGGVKDSGALRETYLSLDGQYLAAKERVDMLTALVKFLDNKLDAYKMAHDDSKKIYDKLSEGPFAKTGYEGMSSGGKLGDVE